MVRKILHFLKGVPRGPLHVRLGPLRSQVLNNRLMLMAKYICSDFSHKPRSIEYLKYWKATELREFLLVSGPVALYDNCVRDVYNNIIFLHVCTSILVDPELVTGHLNSVDRLLERFIDDYKSIYGESNCVYNVHNLVHLTDDIRRYQCTLNDISAFPFENYMQVLKRALRKAEKPLEQIINRHGEGSLIRKTKKTRKSGLQELRTTREPCPFEYAFYSQYKQLHLSETILKCDKRDSNVMINDCIVKIVNFLQRPNSDEIYVLYKIFRNKRDLYTWPIRSSEIGIYIVDNAYEELNVSNSSRIKCKYVLVPHGNNYVAFPLWHTKGCMHL